MFERVVHDQNASHRELLLLYEELSRQRGCEKEKSDHSKIQIEEKMEIRKVVENTADRAEQGAKAGVQRRILTVRSKSELGGDLTLKVK